MAVRLPRSAAGAIAAASGSGPLPVRAGILASRAVALVLGSAISTCCYAVTIRADRGLGPLFVLQDGLARSLGISIGTAVMLVGAGLVVLAWLMGSWPRPGTLALPFIGGGILDAVLPVTPAVHGFALSLGLDVVATWVMALGGVLTIRCAVGTSAYDQVMLCIHRFSGWPIAVVRVVMEVFVLTAGWLLGGSAGIGTVVTGVLIGPSLQFWMRVIRWPAALSPGPVADRRTDGVVPGEPPATARPPVLPVTGGGGCAGGPEGRR